MSEINGRKHADYAGYTPGPWNYVGGGDWTAGDDSQFLDLDESSMEGISNLCLIRAAADPLTGLAATLAKLAATECDRDDWKRVAAIWREKRLMTIGPTPPLTDNALENIQTYFTFIGLGLYPDDQIIEFVNGWKLDIAQALTELHARREGVAAILAKLAAMERDRNDWERRAFAAGAECDHWRANHASIVDRKERRTIAIQEGRA